MYYIDSLGGGVDAFPFDAPSGGSPTDASSSTSRSEHGEPDGLTVDSSGLRVVRHLAGR